MAFEEAPDEARPNMPSGVERLEQWFDGRLHPASLVIIPLNHLVRGFLPIAFSVFAGEGQFLILVSALVLVPGLFAAVAQYFFFEYELGSGELTIRSGMLSRQQRSIPVERVQNVDIEQGPMHRLLGVADLKIETAGGSGPEATLSVLGLPEAHRLRAAVLQERERTQRATPHPAGQPANEALRRSPPQMETRSLFSLEPRELLLSGVTSTRLGPIVAAGALALQLMAQYNPGQIDSIANELLTKEVPATSSLVLSGLAMGVGVVMAATLAALLFSVGRSIWLFHHFELTLVGEDLRRRHGLVTLYSATLPRPRIQVLRIDQPLLKRLFNRVSVRADSAGSPQAGQDVSTRDILLPQIEAPALPEMLPSFLPELEAWPPPFNRVSPLSVGRGFRRGLLGLSLCCGALVAPLGSYALLPLVGIPLLHPLSKLRYRNLGWALDGNYLHTRRGWLGRKSHIVPLRKVQGVSLRANPFDRRLGLVRLVVDTAGQGLGGAIEVQDLTHETGEHLVRELGRAAAHSRFEW